MQMKNKIILLVLVFSIVIGSAIAQLYGEAVVISLLNQDPDPAISGDIVELRFGVENHGDDPSGNYFVEIAPQYPFEAIPGEDLVKNVGKVGTNVEGDNLIVVKFKVRVDKDATAGTYNIPVLTYEEGKRDTNDLGVESPKSYSGTEKEGI